MRSILYSALILLPVLVLSQKCPKFQSVIPLRPSVSSNFSYAIVTDGNYYLLGSHDQNRKNVEPTGRLPEGFEESRLITLVDRSACNDSEYYLMTIKSIQVTQEMVETNYSTLDLINWSPQTKWSESKSLSEHPLFRSDPYIKIFNQFDPNVQIEDFVHNIFYWEQTQIYFVVTKPIKRDPSEPIKSSSLRYYLANAQNSCAQSYDYSKTPESLSKALNTVIEPLDFCFFSHQTGLTDPLLYCVGDQSFAVNSILNVKNGSVRSESIGIPESLPTIGRLKLLSTFCSSDETVVSNRFGDKDRIRVRIDEIRIGVIDKSAEEKVESEEWPRVINKGSFGGPPMPPMPEDRVVDSTSVANPEAEDSSSTFIIVLVCLAIFVLIMIGILIIAARRQQQIAKM